MYNEQVFNNRETTMNLEETYFSKPLRDYIANHCSKEPSLLANLRVETANMTDAPQMMCGPLEGQFLKMLTQLSSAKNILEIGTFTGYSTLYLASALTADGKIITCEIDERHATIAQKYFDRSPHGSKIDLRLGSALDTVADLEGPFDLVFIDADKKNYPNYYETILPKVRPGGLIVIDNTLWGGKVLNPTDLETKTIASLNHDLKQDTRIEMLMLAVRDGITLCRKKS